MVKVTSRLRLMDPKKPEISITQATPPAEIPQPAPSPKVSHVEVPPQHTGAKFNTAFFDGTPEETLYYNTVRLTLQGLDGVRLTAAVSGLTLVSGLIGIGYSAKQYSFLDTFNLWGQPFPVSHLLAFTAFIVAFVVGEQYSRKISMFSHFIVSCVKIAKKIEKRCIQDESLQLTTQFNQHPNADKGGDKLFLRSLKILQYVALCGVLLSLYEIYHHYFAPAQTISSVPTASPSPTASPLQTAGLLPASGAGPSVSPVPATK